MDFASDSVVKNPPANVGDMGSIPGSERYPAKGNSNPWPGKSHGQRSLAGCHPWGGKESDMTEQLNNNNSELVSPRSVFPVMKFYSFSLQ